jgi:osmotically inducible protein OsmC
VPAKSQALPAFLVESADWAPFCEALSLGAGALAAGMTGTWKAGVTRFMTGFSKWRANAACRLQSYARPACARLAWQAPRSTLPMLLNHHTRNAMADKIATVHWEGRGKQGVGRISTETAALKSYPYGFASRFEDDKKGTNPEELLGAAHAACFTMAFSFACDAAGFDTKSVDTKAAVRLVMKGGGFSIEHIALTLEANVPGIDEATFQKIAAKAKADCPLSKALAGVPEIALTAVLRKD